MPLDDYGALLQSGRAAVPDYAAQEAQRQLIGLRRKELQAQTEKAQRQIDEKQVFDEDIAQLLTNPTSEGYARMIVKHPDFATQIKQSHEILDAGRQQADLTQMAEVYSAAANGRHDLAAQLMKRRVEADKAGDGQADPTDEAILAALESNDPVQQKAALGMMGLGLSAITGPDKFHQTLGELTKGSEGYTLGPGMKRYDAEGNLVASAPFAPQQVKVGEGETVFEYQPGGGDQTTGGGATISPDLPADQSAVASTLASAGLPSHVAAGFLGNFHVEGGYGGAQGDGGAASGIAQWHPERLKNFERVVGKPVSEASPEEQAKFVVWEMQHPEDAGMTTEQRDAILNSKSAPQAAALIDQFYERSSGEHRNLRMAAANSFARGGQPQNAEQPQGTSGDARVVVQGPAKTPEYQLMTPEENTAAGLDPNVRYQRNTKTGQVTALGGQDRSQGQLKPVPPQARNLIVNRRDAMRQVDTALAALDKNPGAIGYIKGNLPDSVVQRTDPKGVATRAAIGKVSGQIIHDVSGAAVTLSEAPRFRPYIPALTDTPGAAKDKLRQLRALLDAELGDMSATYGPENGYKGVNLDPVRPGSGSSPVKVRSIQEANKLPSGTLFTAPNGKTYRKK